MYPLLGVIVKVWLEPELTLTDPEGEIVPLAPALAVSVYVVTEKLAAIVCAAVTFENVYEVAGVTAVPSINN